MFKSKFFLHGLLFSLIIDAGGTFTIIEELSAFRLPILSYILFGKISEDLIFIPFTPAL